MPFWIDFWSILPPNLPPKIHWNVSKIDAKMHSILDSMFGSIFGWFWLPTWIPWAQFGTSGLVPNAFFRVFWEIDVWSYFGANLAPFWHPKSTKIHAKIDSKRHPKNDRFLDRFFAQVGSILGPKLGPKSRSRRSQNASPKLFQTFQDATKTAQEPQEHPRSKFGPFLIPKSDGVPPRASIFEVFSTFKFKFWCQICARELGKFYIKF